MKIAAIRIVSALDFLLLGLLPAFGVIVLVTTDFRVQTTIPPSLVALTLRFLPGTVVAGIYGWLITGSVSMIILITAYFAWCRANNAFRILVFTVVVTRVIAIPFWIGFARYESPSDTISRMIVNVLLVVINVVGYLVVGFQTHPKSTANE